MRYGPMSASALQAAYGCPLGPAGIYSAQTKGMGIGNGGGDGWVTYVFCISRSGRMTPEEKMAPADLAVP